MRGRSDGARIGLVGARGFVGAELLGLIGRRADMALGFAASRQHVGAPVSELAPGAVGLDQDVRVAASDPQTVALAVDAARLDAVVLALPNGLAASYVAALPDDVVIVDVSGDHRDAPGWVYGLPEVDRTQLAGARRIANPGCFATAAQLALHPLRAHLAGPASVFGVSGWSGAGSTPNPRNDAARLADNILPYALAGHAHEQEIARGVGAPVRFSPHVTSFFRGLIATVHAPVSADGMGGAPMTGSALRALVEETYAGEPLISVRDEPPTPADARETCGAILGGFAVASGPVSGTALGPDGAGAPYGVMTCAIDNLLKGAASQVIQNLSLALGLPEFDGLQAPPAS